MLLPQNMDTCRVPNGPSTFPKQPHSKKPGQRRPVFLRTLAPQSGNSMARLLLPVPGSVLRSGQAAIQKRDHLTSGATSLRGKPHLTHAAGDFIF